MMHVDPRAAILEKVAERRRLRRGAAPTHMLGTVDRRHEAHEVRAVVLQKSLQWLPGASRSRNRGGNHLVQGAARADR